MKLCEIVVLYSWVAPLKLWCVNPKENTSIYDLYKGWFEPGDCYEPKSGPKCHGTDEWDHHASNMGSYLSACVHFSTLFGVPCKGNAFR